MSSYYGDNSAVELPQQPSVSCTQVPPCWVDAEVSVKASSAEHVSSGFSIRQAWVLAEITWTKEGPIWTPFMKNGFICVRSIQPDDSYRIVYHNPAMIARVLFPEIEESEKLFKDWGSSSMV